MLTIANQKGSFKVRVAGIMRQENNILLLNEPLFAPYWFLPGGRAEMHESTKETLSRELEEEIQGVPLVGDLLWVTENFFVRHEVPYHTLEFYTHFSSRIGILSKPWATDSGPKNKPAIGYRGCFSDPKLRTLAKAKTDS